MDQVCGEVCTGRVRDGQPQYDQLPGGGRSTLTTDHSNDKHKVQLSNLKIYNYFVIFWGGGGGLFIFLGFILLILISALLKQNLL